MEENLSRPARARSGSDAVCGRGSHGIHAFQSHLFDHFDAAGEGKSGMLVGAHPVGRPEWIGCLATSSLSNPIRMNTGHNPLKLHAWSRARSLRALFAKPRLLSMKLIDSLVAP